MVTAIREVGKVEVDIDPDGYLLIIQTDFATGEEHGIAIPTEMAKNLVDAIALCMREKGAS
jgi:hypothetical protein